MTYDQALVKRCTRCGHSKAATEFHWKVKGRRLQAQCKACVKEWARENRSHLNAYQRQWREANPERVLAHRVRQYGISADDYKTMLANQDGVCAICKESSPDRLQVDHDHRTGKVRGLLCWRCNLVIGKAADDPKMLRAAADYVEMVC